MSYVSPGCLDMFTPMQIARMHTAIDNSAILKNAMVLLLGPDVLCASETYTVANLPTGTTVTGWDISPTGAITLSGSGNSRTATKVATYNGQMTLTVTLSTACGDVQVQRQFWTGYAQIADVTYGSMTVPPHALVPLHIYMQPDYSYGGYFHRFEITGQEGIQLPNMEV